MRSFRHIAKLIRTKRMTHSSTYSQSELSHLLGYKNGQFISNVERALCNIPLKMLSRVCEVLDIEPQELKEAIMHDHEETLDNYLSLDPAKQAPRPHRRGRSVDALENLGPEEETANNPRTYDNITF